MQSGQKHHSGGKRGIRLMVESNRTGGNAAPVSRVELVLREWPDPEPPHPLPIGLPLDAGAIPEVLRALDR